MYWEAWCRLLESKVNISPSLVLQILRSLYAQNIGNFEQRSNLGRERIAVFGFSFTNKDKHYAQNARSHFLKVKQVSGPSLHCLLYRPNKALLWHTCLPVNLADTCNTLSVRIGNGREELQFITSRMHDALETTAKKKLNMNESFC